MEYNRTFSNAKNDAVYDFAMTWIRHFMKQEDKTEMYKFQEIKKIVDEATKHLTE